MVKETPQSNSTLKSTTNSVITTVAAAAATPTPIRNNMFLSNVLTINFTASLALGQFLSLCLAVQQVLSSSSTSSSSPVLLSAALRYLVLFVVFGSYFIDCYGLAQWLKIKRKRWYIYLSLALLDLEASFLSVNFFCAGPLK